MPSLPRSVGRPLRSAYIEVDPRVVRTFESALPFVWDQNSERGKCTTVDAYLDDAMAHGVASGVSFVIYSPIGGHVLAAFNSARPEIDELRRFESRTTLNVSSRQEAVGKAIEERIIRHGRLPDVLNEISEQRAQSSRPTLRPRPPHAMKLVR